jgi:BirA family transcriptional regulator, biotin operon repressor / biotin---[acetyl-CoA-carboxylase] ligase
VDAVTIRSALVGSRFGDVRVVDTIDSTNRALSAWAAAGHDDDGRAIGDGAVLIARAQSAGRGRLGRRWIAPVDSALLMSALVVPSDHPTDRWPLLSFAMGLAVIDAADCGTALKWPNDVIIADTHAPNGYRKLAGILAESSVGPNHSHVVIGVGVNLNRPVEVPDLGVDAVPTWLDEHTAVSSEAFTAAVLRGFESYVQILTSDPVRFLERYRLVCTTIGQRVTADLGDRAIVGTALDIDVAGRLVVIDETKKPHVLSAGDVQHLRPIPQH